MKLRRIPTSKSCKVRVGLTIGDPSGIGPAIILKALPKLKGQAEFVVIGDAQVLNKVQKSKSKNQQFKLIDLENVNPKGFSFGKIKAEYGRASIEYLDRALEMIETKEIDCLVTAPISKEAINLAGYRYAGHTEYFSARTHTKDTVMMLLNQHLKFSLVTRHIPLSKVALSLDQDKLYKTIVVTYEALKKLFYLNRPRIVVCGLNPHASDGGLFGKEESRIIQPVVDRLKKIISYLSGPLPADVAIAGAKIKKYDCLIAMYHDQALIPLKLTGYNTGVNLTLGLPFIRTSPLHGTAFDIAKNFKLVNANSLIKAIELAIRCTLNLRKA
jgi:4-hydroxythreonine-4-phosphate dehydrogenase